MKKKTFSLLWLVVIQVLFSLPSSSTAEGPTTLFLPLIYPREPQILHYVEAQRGGAGLWYPNVIAASPDEQFLYLRGTHTQTLVVLQRDEKAGSLSWVQQFTPVPANSLGGGGSMVMSPDGKHIYMTAVGGLAVLGRDDQTGQVQTLHIYSYDEKPFDQSPLDMAFSPDGRYLYIAQSQSIVLLERNQQDGTLNPVRTYESNADFPMDWLSLAVIRISEDSKSLYVATQNYVLTFARDVATGELQYLSKEEIVPGHEGDIYVWDMEIDPKDRFLYISSAQDHVLSIFQRNVNTGSLQHVQTVTDAGSHEFNPASVWVTSDSSELIVASQPNIVLRFQISQDNGAITLLNEQTSEPSPSDHPKFLQTWGTQDGKFVYVTSGHWEVDDHVDGVLVFNRNSNAGSLTFKQLFSNNDVGVPGLWGAEMIAVSPDGRHVYATSIWENALVAFTRNPQSGKLTHIATYRQGLDGVDGLAFPRTLVISSTGDYIFSGSFDEGKIAIFRRNSDTGRLTFIRAWQTDLQSISWLALSPDDAFVYAVGYQDRKIAAFSFNLHTGALAPVQSISDDELLRASYVAMSPDGKHVYIGKRYDRYQSHSVLLYDRNAQTGRLTFHPAPHAIAADTSQILFSDDGRYVYFSSYGEDLSGKLFVNNRDPATGELSFVQSIFSSHDFPDFRVISGEAISPNGRLFFAVSQKDAALHVFARDQQSGKLFWKEVHKNGTYDIDSLIDATRVTVSPDGKHVYVTSTVGTITVFEIANLP